MKKILLTYWIYFKVGILLFVLNGCSPTVRQIQRHCDEYAKICNPATIIKDSITESTVTIYRDTTIIVELEPKVIHDSIVIKIPSGTNIVKNEIEIYTKFGTAKAWINKNVLNLAFTPDTSVVFYLKNALRDQIIQKNNYKNTMEAATPGNHFNWNKYIAWFIIAVFAAFVLWQVLKRIL